jgi:hypothetical protein
MDRNKMPSSHDQEQDRIAAQKRLKAKQALLDLQAAEAARQTQAAT